MKEKQKTAYVSKIMKIMTAVLMMLGTVILFMSVMDKSDISAEAMSVRNDCIYFDNSEVKWGSVYIYAYSSSDEAVKDMIYYKDYGHPQKMKKIPDTNIYYYYAPMNADVLLFADSTYVSTNGKKGNYVEKSEFNFIDMGKLFKVSIYDGYKTIRRTETHKWNTLEENYLELNVKSTGMKINKQSLQMEIGSEYFLYAFSLPEYSNDYGEQWKSSDSSVASVSKGVVKANKVGTAVITVKNNSGKTASCTVTVKKKPVLASKVTLSMTSLVIGKGEEVTVSATVLPSNTDNKKLTWTTSNSKVATVSGGKIKGVGTGSATIRAKTSNGKTARCVVKVKNAPTEATLTKGILTMGVGEAFVINAGVNSGAASSKLTFRTSDSSIVKMIQTEGKAKFQALKPGIAYVTVRTYNGKEKACRVTVKAAPKSVKLNKGIMNLYAGQSASLNAILPDNTGCAKLTFRTSNSSIVRMTKTDGKGVFTAEKEGTAWVTVRTFNGKEASCKVIVHKSWREAYEDVIAEKIGDASDLSNSSLAFELFDIDNDGIPELIISYGGFRLAGCSLYCYDNYKVKELNVHSSEWGELFVNHKGDIYAHFQTGLAPAPVTLISWDYFYKKRGGKADLIYDLYLKCEYDKKTETSSYYCQSNGKDITKKQWDNIMEANYREDMQAVGRKYMIRDVSYRQVIDNY